MNSLRRSSAHLAAVTRRRRSVVPKPPTVERKRRESCSKCSLIGEIAAPVREFNLNGNDPDRGGVYTFLRIKDPLATQDNNCSPLRILLAMRGELAEICHEHLKPKEFVYVFGHLGSYNKIDLSGAHNILYKVEVCELNYVQMKSKREMQCKDEDLYEKESTILRANETSSASSNEVINYEEKNRERLILWQIFFANPQEWRDFRAKKPSKNFPDFRHKNSGEALWINPNDPLWVKKQLELYDSNSFGFKKRFWKNENFGLDRWKIE